VTYVHTKLPKNWSTDSTLKGGTHTDSMVILLKKAHVLKRVQIRF